MRRRPIHGLPITALTQQKPKNFENEKRLRALKTGSLKINGVEYDTNIQDLEYLSELGNGTSGHVVKMRHKPSGAIIAVKQMRRTGNDEETKRITMDLDVVLKSQDCPYIVQCLGCFITEADVWICMELMSTCFDKLQKRAQQPIPEDILRHVTLATVKALYYLKNNHGVIHRDVKPSNILIDEQGRIKICDFGISGRLVDSKAKTRSAGCAAYMAPERIDPKKPEYDIRADVWSLGITLVELATNAYPYKDCKTDFEVLTKVLDSDPPCLPDDQGFSEGFKDFVKRTLTKDFRHRPKYDQLLLHPFLNFHFIPLVDVSSWFFNIAKEVGFKLPTSDLPPLSASHLQRTSMNTTATSMTMTIQSSSTVVDVSVNDIPKKEHDFLSNLQNSFLLSNTISPSNNLDYPSSIIPTSSNIIFSDSNSLYQPQQSSILNNSQIMSDDVMANCLDFRTGNGYQKLTTAPTTHDFAHAAEEELRAKFNRMHTQSPQLPRKTYATLNTNSTHYLPPSSTLIAPPESPRLQSKFQHHNHQQQPDYHNHYQQYTPQHIHNAYKPLPQSTFSPVVKKRFGVDGNMVAEDLEFRILHGNTSPIVLQRFYHQQKQFRDQNQEELRAMQNAALPTSTTHHTNPFESHIPIARNSPSPYYNKYGTSPARNVNHFESNYYNNASPQQHHDNFAPRNGNLSYKVHVNNSPIHTASQYHPQSHYQQTPPQIPIRYDRPPIPCPSSPQLDRLRANLEKPNFYERHQLPVEVHLKETITTTSSSNGVSNEKSKGWLTSVSGIVKTYIKARLNLDQSNKESEKMKSLAQVSPIRTNTNPFATSQSIAAPSSKVTSSLISSSYDRHHSPDPPPRTQRGSQSPLILRRKLEMVGSPHMQRRYMSASPSPPPLVPRNVRPYNPIESTNQPHHYHARINYTPEPQRRIFNLDHQ